MSDSEASGDVAGEIIAHAKLPDDLVLAEFESIVDALETLLLLPHDDYFEPYDYPYKDRYRRKSRRRIDADLGLEVVRVQYGSDFLIVMGAAATVLAAAYTTAQIIDKVQDIRLKNEDIHAKKHDRLRRQREEQDALRDTAREALAEVTDDEGPWDLYAERRHWFLDAVATLAWFRVRISISPRRSDGDAKDT